MKFDSEAVSLYGIYKDELSMFRAKKSWTEILESNFLLETNYDYNLNKICSPDKSNYVLQCSFLTACGRYAFWRLTNDQAPEAQYLIETAHIPNCDFTSDMFISAPDLSPLYNESPGTEKELEAEKKLTGSAKLLNQVKHLLNCIKKTISSS